MKVKTLEDFDLLRDSTWHVINQISRLAGIQIGRERNLTFPANIETTNTLVKKYLKRGIIDRPMRGGKITRKRKGKK